ncbi:hypothetical protein [Gimesia sp.]|uniref:hypothetical protein n=1 Tax=Gimesia sp. TaxID=2024833 RepID=UPI003A914F36
MGSFNSGSVLFVIILIAFIRFVFFLINRWMDLEKQAEELKELRGECVRRGIAEQVTDEYGTTEFKLKNTA